MYYCQLAVFYKFGTVSHPYACLELPCVPTHLTLKVTKKRVICCCFVFLSMKCNNEQRIQLNLKFSFSFHKYTPCISKSVR